MSNLDKRWTLKLHLLLLDPNTPSALTLRETCGTLETKSQWAFTKLKETNLSRFSSNKGAAMTQVTAKVSSLLQHPKQIIMLLALQKASYSTSVRH